MKQTNEGQLLPLSQRKTQRELERRAERISVRAALSREHGMTRAVAVKAYKVTSGGFFRRLGWLLFGIGR